jgi:mono/diheme cytochrome c family protein
VQSATSKAFGFEIDESLLKGDVMLAVRPVEFIGGLQASKSGFDVLTTAKPHYGVFDIVARDPNVSPYLYLTLESAVGAASNATYGQPAWRAGLKYAGPLFVPRTVAAAPPGPSTAVTPGTAPVPLPSAASASPTTPSAEDLQAGQKVYATNCAACHAADGTGGVGPSLHGLATRMSLDQTVTFIENPTAPMPKLYPGTIPAEQVQDVATYIRATFR